MTEESEPIIPHKNVTILKHNNFKYYCMRIYSENFELVIKANSTGINIRICPLMKLENRINIS